MTKISHNSKNSAGILTAFGALLCLAAGFTPVLAQAEGAAAPAKTQLGGPTIGAGLCGVTTTDIDFGTFPAGSSGLINVPGKLHISCNGVTTRTKFCLMIYPTANNEHQRVGDNRVLYYTGTTLGAEPAIKFQFVMDGQNWGGGAANNDYGAPYADKTGFYIHTGFDLAFTGRLNLAGQNSAALLAGDYTNKYHLKMVYTNTPWEGKASALCKADHGHGLLVNAYNNDIQVHAKIAP